jgi:SlyX protein
LNEIEELQMKVAFQENTIEELNQSIIAQQKQIDDLTFKMKHVTNKLKELSVSQLPNSNEHEIPPHY